MYVKNEKGNMGLPYPLYEPQGSDAVLKELDTSIYSPAFLFTDIILSFLQLSLSRTGGDVPPLPLT